MTRAITEDYQTYGISIGQAGKENLQGRRLQRILETSKNVSRYLVTTRATGTGCMNKVHRNFSMVGDEKGKGHIGSREFIGEYLRHLPVKQIIIWKGGSPGGSIHENLELELAKSLTRKDKRVHS